MPGRSASWSGLVWGILAVAAMGCGGGEDPLASPTVRPIGAPVERKAERVADPEAAATSDWEMPGGRPNRPPRLLALQVVPAEEVNGRNVAVRTFGEDPDGDDIRYRYTWWVNGVEVQGEGPTLSTRGLSRGDTVRVRVVATDGHQESKPIEGPVLTVENGAPIILSKPTQPGPDGLFLYQVRAEDPDGERGLRYELARAPQGMTVSALGGLVRWRPRRDQLGVHPVEIVVEDGGGARATQSFELTLSPPEESPPPAALNRGSRIP
jgi:hypothetical protein